MSSQTWSLIGYGPWDTIGNSVTVRHISGFYPSDVGSHFQKGITRRQVMTCSLPRTWWYDLLASARLRRARLPIDRQSQHVVGLLLAQRWETLTVLTCLFSAPQLENRQARTLWLHSVSIFTPTSEKEKKCNVAHSVIVTTVTFRWLGDCVRGARNPGESRGILNSRLLFHQDYWYHRGVTGSKIIDMFLPRLPKSWEVKAGCWSGTVGSIISEA